MPTIASRARVLTVIGASLVLGTASYLFLTDSEPKSRKDDDHYVCRLPVRPANLHGGVTVHATLAGATQRALVAITRPLAPNHVRPPVALAIALDDGAAMAGARWDVAAASSVIALIERLDDNDSFSLTTGAGADTGPLTRATIQAKHEAIARIRNDHVGHSGAKAAAASLESLVARAAHSLDIEHPPATARVVLVTADDRHAELAAPGAVAKLAVAAHGHAVSAANAGEDDRGALAQLAAATGGNYYTPSATELDRLVGGELAGFAQQPAHHMRVNIAGEWISVDDVLPGETAILSRPHAEGDVTVVYTIDPSADAVYGDAYEDVAVLGR